MDIKPVWNKTAGEWQVRVMCTASEARAVANSLASVSAGWSSVCVKLSETAKTVEDDNG